METEAEYGQDQQLFFYNVLYYENIGQLLSNFDKGLYLQKANTYLTSDNKSLSHAILSLFNITSFINSGSPKLHFGTLVKTAFNFFWKDRPYDYFA